jgi:hypothetical protein
VLELLKQNVNGFKHSSGIVDWLKQEDKWRLVV